jgi:hypothetical protein
MTACVNCPGPNAAHQHVAEGGLTALQAAIDATRRANRPEQPEA